MRHILVFAPSLSLVLAACGGGTSGPSADRVCTDVANAECAELAKCDPIGIQARWGDLTTCQTRLKLGCMQGLSVSNTGNDPARVESCAQSYATLSCGDYFQRNLAEACLPPTGPVASGGACAFDGQCASAWCGVQDTALCGTCSAPPAAGSSCADSPCPNGLVCDNRTEMCAAPVAAAGACNDAMPCVAGTSCIGATASSTGTCQADAETLGASCNNRMGPRCDGAAGLYCDATSGTCKAIVVAAGGAPCGLVGGVVTACGGGGVCVRPAGGASGTCSAPAADGGACDTMNGPPCLAPARCVTSGTSTAGTCQMRGGMCG